MRNIWMTITMTERSAFHLTLANSALFLTAEINKRIIENAESIDHYTMAVKLTEKRLQDPIDAISEGVIGTVLGFACHDVCISLFDNCYIRNVLNPKTVSHRKFC
jgi:hypothetical protein